MIVAIALGDDGTAGHGLGRAPRVAIARVEDGSIQSWSEHETRWDVRHDEGSEGSHHARIARFMTENGVEMVVAGHMGPPMVQMLGRMGVAVRLDGGEDARAAVLTASSSPRA